MKSMRSCGRKNEDAKTRRRLIRDLVCTCVLLAASSPAAPAGRVATIKAITRMVLPDAVRVTIEIDAEVPQFHDERLAGPPRVFVDLPATRAAAALVDRTLRFDRDEDIVRVVRVGRHPRNTTRVVLDAAGVSSYSVYPLYHPFRLVIDCARELRANAAADRTSRTSMAPVLLSPPPARPLPSRLQANELGRRLPLRR